MSAVGELAAAERAIAWTTAGGVGSAVVHPPTMVLPVMAMPVEMSLLRTRTHVKNLPEHAHARAQGGVRQPLVWGVGARYYMAARLRTAPGSCSGCGCVLNC